uniref:Rhodanese domain-containing protein n=1 Tax=Brassica oleracea TaxID=3712 RepID=A0A3P6H593_BRAOL|nr:unnamed protein product [Brassica oleracea]
MHCFKVILMPWIIPSLLKTDKPIMASGVTACILTLGLHRLGKTEVPVYDGSWTEWAT